MKCKKKKMEELPKLLFLNGVHCVLVEGGAGVHGILNDFGIGDALMVFIAPKWVGGKDAHIPMGVKGVQKMSEAKTLTRQGLILFKWRSAYGRSGEGSSP